MNLISYAVMRVNLAAQALIDPVGNVSNRFGPEEAEGTGQFFIMDKLIECLKCKGTYLKNHSYNHMLPVDDIRFERLAEFLQYCKSWKESIEARNDTHYTENAKSKRFISWQRYEGLQINVLSFKEVCKFLLQQFIPYILYNGFVRMILVY